MSKRNKKRKLVDEMSTLSRIMRGRFRSFRSRVLLFAALTSAVVVTLVSAALVTGQHFYRQERAAEQLAMTGEIIALHVTATLRLQDQEAAVETMQALGFIDHLEAAYLIDVEGAIFAGYVGDPERALPEIVKRDAGLYRQPGWMIHYKPVIHDDDDLGTLVLVYDTAWMTERLRETIVISSIIAVFAMGLAMLVALRLQRSLAGPITELVSTSRAVSETGDYSIKANKFEQDELGELTDAFNAMLARIDQAQKQLSDREQRLTTLTNAVPAFVWSGAVDGRTTNMNDRWYEFTGMRRDEDLAERIVDYIHPVDMDKVLVRWQESVKEEKPFEAEMRCRRHDGAYRWFLARAIPLHDENGNIIGWFGTATDIEDRKQAEAERDVLLASERAARSEAERVSRVKDEFVATLSHELRTPMTAVLGWAQMLLRREIPDDAIKDGLQIIERNARTQAQMIEDLLDMSRIVSGKIQLDVQDVALADVIDGAVRTVEQAAAAKEISLEPQVDPAVGPVRGDPHRLQQIVWNLLSNAVKFTPQGGRVKVSLKRTDGQVQIDVNDSGEGISAEFLPHLFDRFRQSDATTAREHGGLGLGLAIVKHLTELHGGYVSATSPGKGHGSTFTVILPVTTEPPPDEEKDEREESAVFTPSRIEPTALDGVRVLLVEDQSDARTLIQQMLESADAEVVTAASAEAGLDALDEFVPDVIVSDIGMPVMDGYEFIREIRQRSSEKGGRTPAVALTAFARSDDRTRAMMAGYQMHVAKPIDPAELLATVAALAHYNAHRDGQDRS